MKTKLTKIIMSSLAIVCASVCLLAAMTLSTHSTAQAAPDGRCDARQLRGLYIWTFDGYQNFGGNPVPKALMIGIQFNGNGTFTIPFSHGEHRGECFRSQRRGRNVYGRSGLHRHAASHRRYKLQYVRRSRCTAALDHPDRRRPRRRYWTRRGNGDTAARVKASTTSTLLSA